MQIRFALLNKKKEKKILNDKKNCNQIKARKMRTMKASVLARDNALNFKTAIISLSWGNRKTREYRDDEYLCKYKDIAKGWLS